MKEWWHNRKAAQLRKAARKGQEDKARLLLEEYPHIVDRTDERGNTALHEVCAFAHHHWTRMPPIVTLLIARNADIFKRNQAGDTPIEKISKEYDFKDSPKVRTDILTALLPADQNTVNTLRNGKSPFHWACRYGSTADIIRHLNTGANPTLPDDNGTTPLDSIGANMTVLPKNKPVLYKIVHDRIADQARQPQQQAASARSSNFRSPVFHDEPSPSPSHQDRLATSSRAENSAAAQRL